MHGGPKYSKPQRITAEMVEDLHGLSPFDPEHLPEEILLIEAFHRRFSAAASPVAVRVIRIDEELMIVLEGMILKPNMVLPELTSPSKKRWGEYNAAMERT